MATGKFSLKGEEKHYFFVDLYNANLGIQCNYEFKLQNGSMFRCTGKNLRACRIQKNKWLNKVKQYHEQRAANN